MDFKDLSYVVAIAEHQKITTAANALFISQPTLTKFLQRLEHDLGQKLFHKAGNKFLLTYAGQRYVAKAVEILKLKKELDDEMADIVKSNSGELNVGYPAVRGGYMLPYTLPLFKKLYPNVKINTTEAPSASLENMLVDGSVDLAFFNGPPKNPDIAYDIITTEEVVLLLSNKHPLANKGVKKKLCRYPWVDLAEFKDELFILQKPEQRTRQIVDRYLKSNDITLSNVLITSNIRAAADLAAQNYGIAFVCDTHLKHMDLGKNIVCFSFGRPSLSVDFVAAFRKGSYLSSFAQEYIKIVKQVT